MKSDFIKILISPFLGLLFVLLFPAFVVVGVLADIVDTKEPTINDYFLFGLFLCFAIFLYGVITLGVINAF